MVNFFDRLYTSVINKHKFLEKVKYYSFVRFIIRQSANIIIPIYFKATDQKTRYSITGNFKEANRIIVSLTSFPARINRVWLVIESLLRQNEKLDMIILWLSVDQFPTMKTVPLTLLRLQKRGLTIELCKDDLRSHKKYYYAMKSFPKDYIITVDDDVIYHSHLLSVLINLHKEFPSAICCNHASRITVQNGDIAPYVKWQVVKTKHLPDMEIMPIGVGGIMYPPDSLSIEVFDKALFTEKCFLADDIWLNVMARRKGTPVAKTSYYSNYLPVINLKNTTLHSKNINENLNDKQLKSIRTYFITNRGVDPYQNIISNKENNSE